MEEMINPIMDVGGAQYHVSIALIGALLRELVNRNVLTLDDAKSLIDATRRKFDTYGDDIESEQLRETVRLSITDGLNRVLETLQAT